MKAVITIKRSFYFQFKTVIGNQTRKSHFNVRFYLHPAGWKILQPSQNVPFDLIRVTIRGRKINESVRIIVRTALIV